MNVLEFSRLIENEFYRLTFSRFFLSDRKRMSVIIRTSNNQIKLYCKGADSVIMSRLESSDKNVSLTNDHLASFANDGLRTLCVAYRIIPSEEYEVI